MKASEQDLAHGLRKAMGLSLESSGDMPVPFSFQIDDMSCNDREFGQRREVNRISGLEHEIVVRMEGVGLTLSTTVCMFSDSPAFEYLVRICNDSSRKSPALSDILPLDVTLREASDGGVVVHHARGSSNEINDFMPVMTVLEPGGSMSLQPECGLSSSGTMPFANVAMKNCGLLIGVGWSGQWKMDLNREQNGVLRIGAGMERTRLRLFSSESFRMPRILIVPWSGHDPIRGNNLLRRLMLNHFTPRVDREPGRAPISVCSVPHLWPNGTARRPEDNDEALEKKIIEIIPAIGANNYWLDAYWMPRHERLPWNAGSWVPRQEDFPSGLRVLSDAAHAKGLAFTLWFSPESVYQGSIIHAEYPQYLLSDPRQACRYLFNLGGSEARSFMTDLLSNAVSTFDVDVYRQDLIVGGPLDFWRHNDSVDREGMTEIRHIEGLYRMWDDLRRRHPSIRIDNCAGGGRRIDIETMRRSVVLTRTDYCDRDLLKVSTADASYPIGCQVQQAGLSFFAPVHCGAARRYSAYEFRSVMSNGVLLYSDVLRADERELQKIRCCVQEQKRIQRMFCGDFHPITPVGLDLGQWCAYQYHLADQDCGFALYFRRCGCDDDRMPAGLHGINADRRYSVQSSDEQFDVKQETLTGQQLLEMNIVCFRKPSSMLLEYRCVG